MRWIFILVATLLTSVSHAAAIPTLVCNAQEDAQRVVDVAVADGDEASTVVGAELMQDERCSVAMVTFPDNPMALLFISSTVKDSYVYGVAGVTMDGGVRKYAFVKISQTTKSSRIIKV